MGDYAQGAKRCEPYEQLRNSPPVEIPAPVKMTRWCELLTMVANFLSFRDKARFDSYVSGKPHAPYNSDGAVESTGQDSGPCIK